MGARRRARRPAQRDPGRRVSAAKIMAADLTAEQARALTDDIRAGTPDVQRWLDMVTTAYVGRVWRALGHESWAAYLAAEHPSFPQLRMDPAARRAMTADMRDAGLPIRAIGAALGVGRSTVHRHLAGVPSGTPAAVTGADGKSYPSAQSTRDAPATARTTDAELNRAARGILSARLLLDFWSARDAPGGPVCPLTAGDRLRLAFLEDDIEAALTEIAAVLLDLRAARAARP